MDGDHISGFHHHDIGIDIGFDEVEKCCQMGEANSFCL